GVQSQSLRGGGHSRRERAERDPRAREGGARPRVRRPELAAWSMSAAGGVVIGLSLITGGTVGLVTAAVLVVAAMRLIQRMAALAGIIVGFGATVLAGGML